ncbi:MAG: hypothetical protein ACRELB_25250, partial [Polyangiaceae bacterium]
MVLTEHASTRLGEVVDPIQGRLPPAVTVEAPLNPAVQGVGSRPAFTQFPLKTTPTSCPLQETVTIPAQSVAARQVGAAGQVDDAPVALLSVKMIVG